LIQPAEEVTTSYVFRPDPLLEMRDFGLVVNIYYNDVEKSGERGTNFTSTVYNSTVDIVEPEGGFDAQIFFAYLAIVAVLGLISYVLYRNVASWTKGKRRTTKTNVDSSSSKQLDNDWLSGTSADPTMNKRTKSPNVASPSQRKKQN